jgi:heparanase
MLPPMRAAVDARSVTALAFVGIFSVSCSDDERIEPAPTPIPVRDASVTVDGSSAVATVSDRYLSIAVDSAQAFGGLFWSASGEVGSTFGDVYHPPLDFSAARLRNLAAALAPAYLRIGGSMADDLYYDLSDAPVDEAPEGYDLVLTRALWDRVIAFTVDLDYDLLFTLNAGPGPRDYGMGDENPPWVDDNARVLLEHVQAENQHVAVWELGNEINGFPFIHGLTFKISAEQYALDFGLARALVDELDPDAQLAGPASAYWPLGGEINGILPEFVALAGPDIDVLSWHYYPQQSRRCPLAELRASPDVVLDPTMLANADTWASEVESAAEQHAPQAQIWLGETGGAQCGGEPGLNDAFVGGFWWLDQLGRIAKRGQPVMIRQSLTGASYGLLDDDWNPRPDYFNSLVWRRLMGTTVLAAEPIDDAGLLLSYAHCTPGVAGALTVAVLNLDRNSAAKVSLAGVPTGEAELYRFTATSLDSAELELNGQVLAVGEDGSPPSLTPIPLEGELELPPTSYAFVVLPLAGAAACP